MFLYLHFSYMWCFSSHLPLFLSFLSCSSVPQLYSFWGHWNLFMQYVPHHISILAQYEIFTDRIPEICQERSEHSSCDRVGMCYDTKLDGKPLNLSLAAVEMQLDWIPESMLCCNDFQSLSTFSWKQSSRLLSPPPFYLSSHLSACLCCVRLSDSASLRLLCVGLCVYVFLLTGLYNKHAKISVDSRCHGNSMTVASSLRSNRHWWGKYAQRCQRTCCLNSKKQSNSPGGNESLTCSPFQNQCIVWFELKLRQTSDRKWSKSCSLSPVQRHMTQGALREQRQK